MTGKTVEVVSTVEDLRRWMSSQLELTLEPDDIALIAGDASPRKYFRVTPGAWAESSDANAPRSLVGVISPASEKNQEFLTARELLTQAGVRVPALVAADLDHGALLLEDLGDDVLLPILSEYSAGAWYGMALGHAARMTRIAMPQPGLGNYDRTLIEYELGLFPEWFVSRQLSLTSAEASKPLLREVTECLLQVFEAQPQVFVHRDFHSRNLMTVQNGQLAVIDFQDACRGPITYDAASLLKDCYLRWPRRRQVAWLRDYQAMLEEQGALEATDPGVFLRWFDLTGLQRHLKVLGIFARLNLRDGKPGYLQDLPRVLAYVMEVLGIYARHEPAIAELKHWFETEILEASRAQPWFDETMFTAPEMGTSQP